MPVMWLIASRASSTRTRCVESNLISGMTCVEYRPNQLTTNCLVQDSISPDMVNIGATSSDPFVQELFRVSAMFCSV